MTDWTEDDGYTLRNALRNHPELGDCDLVDACARAAGHIEALESRIATLEAERAEVARELRASGSAGSTNAGWAVVTPQELLALAARLERKDPTND